MGDNKNNFQIKVAKFNLAAEKLKTFRIVLILGSVIAIGLAVLLCFNLSKSTPTVSTSTLEKVVNISDLAVYQVTYKGIAPMYDENLEDIDYLVRYEATAKLKTDFSNIKFDTNDELKEISVYVPDVNLSYDDISLDLVSLSDKTNYMNYGNDDYDVGASHILISKCKDDVYDEITHEEGLYNLARESAEKTITSLIKPFVSDYDLKFVWEVGE